MTTQLSNRRPRAFEDDSPESRLQGPSLISAYPSSLAYSTTSSTIYSPIALDNTISLGAFNGTQIQRDTFDYNSHQYQQHHLSLQGQAPQHPQHPQKGFQQHSSHHVHHPSKKRQRVEDPTMQCLPISWSSRAIYDDEKSLRQDYSEDGVCAQGAGIFSFTTIFGTSNGPEPPTSVVFGPPNSYQAIPPGTYEDSASRAFPEDLQSPSDTPQHMNLSAHGTEQPGVHNLMDSANAPLFIEHQPLLQPTRHPQMLYTTPMHSSNLYTNPSNLKIETTDHDFPNNNIHSNSVYMPHLDSPHSAPGIAQSESEPYSLHITNGYPLRYPPSHGFVPEASHSYGYYPLVSQGDELPPSQKPTPTRRGPFKDKQARARTAQTRKMGSCIRCRMQRIRCEIDEDSPGDENAPCDCCKKISVNSKVHRIPCRRWKLVDVRLSKPGNVDVEALIWTHRWKDTTAMPEITQWEDNQTRSIMLSDGLLSDGVIAKVRKFVRLDGDLTTRSGVDEAGNEWEVEIKEYALVDVAAVKMDYERYLSKVHAQMFTEDAGDHSKAQRKIFEQLLGSKNGLLWKTYQQAWSRRDDGAVTMKERDLLSKVLDLWVAVRLTTRSFEIKEIKGEKTLGIEKVNDKILLPPVMGQQLDKMLLDHTLTKLRRETLFTLQEMTQDKKQSTWLTTYLVSFMLLHNVSLITDHDMKYARKHATKLNSTRSKKLLIWARPSMVQQYHLGANILLAYFHYCNRGTYPFSDECKQSDLQNLAALDKNAIDFVKWTRQQADSHKDDWRLLRSKGFEQSSTDEGAAEKHADAYSNPYFFVSQLYENNWTPRDSLVDKTSCRKIGPSQASGQHSTK